MGGKQYCSIWWMVGLQSSCWRGREERRAEMCGIAGWAAPAATAIWRGFGPPRLYAPVGSCREGASSDGSSLSKV